MLTLKKFMNIFKKLKPFFVKPDSTLEKQKHLRERFLIFQRLLQANNNVLELMADMSEKLSGEYLFDKKYIEQKVEQISLNVKEIVESLNRLSGNRYKLLFERTIEIESKVRDLILKKYQIFKDDFVIPFESITKEIIDRVGGKNANLGEIKNKLSLKVPEGFAITAYAFKRFMDYNGFFDRILESLKEISIDNLSELTKVSRQMQDMIIQGDIPNDLEEEINYHIERLIQLTKDPNLRVAVRSSALHEDTEFSFAGQYYTFLNVPSCEIILKYKYVLSSLFTPRAIFYLKNKGIEEMEMMMSVGVIKMVEAVAGGVLYTSDPNKSGCDDILISSVHGLGKCVVDGTITPETYRVKRHPSIEILERKIPKQDKMLFCRLDGEVEEVALSVESIGQPSLTDEQVFQLVEYAIRIENHYGGPQDIEWAIDKDGTLYILQTRPLRTLEFEIQRPVPRHIEGYKLLINKGAIACKGIGFGKAYIVKTDEDLKNFPENGVLVIKQTSPKYVTMMNKASAIIADFGGITGHMASLAREFGVPTILDTEIATKILQNGQELTVDAFNCNIYEGFVEELKKFLNKKPDPFKETKIYKLLQKVTKLVIPLNLSDPDAQNFNPEFCETFHDITRFCHEKAMHELFDIVSTTADEVGAIFLKSSIPMEIWLIDLGGGLDKIRKIVNPENILSSPFKYFFKGLSSMRWPQGQAADVKGFFGLMMRTITTSEEELKKVGEKSFLILAKDYMNFAIRLGYHLSTVEAYATENINENYIKFFFKGGGAILDRRLRRVRLLTKILEVLDFNIKVTDDVINASLMKYKKSKIEEILEIMGKLTVYTKQLDMVLYNDAITDFYIQDFLEKYINR